MSDPLLDRLSRGLAARRPRWTTEWAAEPAAVLLPLFQVGSEWQLLYTVRTDTVERHRGQVSFPGGRIEPDDPDPVTAALREAREEIGVRPEDVRILGEMDPLLTVTQYLISPVVGVIPWPYPLQPDPIEVARIFHVPLAWLADAANHEIQTREPLAGGPPIPVVYFRPYQGQTIWGASARLTLDLLALAADPG